METPLNKEERDQIAEDIDNLGFAFWALECGYDGDKDKRLRYLCAKASQAMNDLDDYLMENEMYYCTRNQD